jgi:hypothetical protein
VQENQQLRSDAAIAATEAEDRRRAAELEKAKAEIERCDSIVFLGKKGQLEKAKAEIERCDSIVFLEKKGLFSLTHTHADIKRVDVLRKCNRW